MTQDNNKSEIRKGLLIAAVLQVIGKKQVYAGEILKTLQPTLFSTQEGTLYPLLSKLKREGLLNHEWVESPSGPPRKYYSLSTEGHAYLRELLVYITSVDHELNHLGGTSK